VPARHGDPGRRAPVGEPGDPPGHGTGGGKPWNERISRPGDLIARQRAVAFIMIAFKQRDFPHENSPPSPAPVPRSACASFRFPSAVIVLAVRRYLRFGLSYRDVEELLAERGVEVDHVTLSPWLPRFTPLLADAARPCRQRPRPALVRG